MGVGVALFGGRFRLKAVFGFAPKRTVSDIQPTPRNSNLMLCAQVGRWVGIIAAVCLMRDKEYVLESNRLRTIVASTGK